MSPCSLTVLLALQSFIHGFSFSSSFCSVLCHWRAFRPFVCVKPQLAPLHDGCLIDFCVAVSVQTRGYLDGHKNCLVFAFHPQAGWSLLVRCHGGMETPQHVHQQEDIGYPGCGSLIHMPAALQEANVSRPGLPRAGSAGRSHECHVSSER